MSEKNDEAVDDRYVIEDSGGSPEDIEHEMEVAAQEAVSGVAAPAAVPDEFRDRYLRTLAISKISPNARAREERLPTLRLLGWSAISAGARQL